MNPPAQRSYTWLFWGMALFGLAADQASKYGLFAGLYQESMADTFLTGKIDILPGVFQLTTQFSGQRETAEGLLASLRTIGGEMLPKVNHGALFGLGGRNSHGGDLNGLFAIVSVAAALAIMYWSTRPLTRIDRWLCLSLGLIVAGTLGNLYDRLVFSGVRDFLHWYYLVDWPVFNIADCCLVCGAGLLLVQAFFTEPYAVRNEEAKVPEMAKTAEVAELK